MIRRAKCRHEQARVVRLVGVGGESAPYAVCVKCGLLVEAEPVAPKAMAVSASAFSEGDSYAVESEALPMMGAIRVACSIDAADAVRAWGISDVYRK